MTRSVRQVGLALAGAALLAWATPPARASESQLEDEPAPETVEDMGSPIDKGFERKEWKETLFPELKRRIQGLPPFLRDTHLLLNLRTFVFNRRNVVDDRLAAWAGGGWLSYESGWLLERFQLGATLQTSQRFWGPSDKRGSLLLRPVQRGYTVLSQAFARVKHEELRLTVGRQELDLPFVNRRDNRMTPQSFQGVTLDDSVGRLEWAAGYLTDIKFRNSQDFISFSEAAGVDGFARRMWFAGARLNPTENLTVGAIDYWVRDTLNLFYTEADLRIGLSDEIGLRVGGQFTDQRSIGNDLLTGSSYDTRVGGALVALSWRNAILSAAFSLTSRRENVISPWGSYPGYLSRMQRGFRRASEEAWGVDLSYHLGRWGLPSLSGFGSYTRGVGARDPNTRESLGDVQEWNLTLDFRPAESRPWWLRGAWLRLRGSVVDEDGAPKTSKEFRIIFNYEIPVL